MEDLNALNKQAVAAAHQHMGHIAWPTIALTGIVVIAYISHLILFANGLVAVWAAIPIMAILTYMSYTPLHEAVHGNIHGRHEQLSWLSKLCGYLVAPLVLIPYASHRHEHFTHHRYTNHPDKDPDFVINGLSKGYGNAFLTIFKFLWMQNAFFVHHHWRSASLMERSIYCLELSMSIGWRVAFIALVDQPGTALVILLGFSLGGFCTGYWFAYRPHLPYQESKRYKNTNSLIMPKWMKPFEWLWLGQNLHSIHHLFPRVPFYRYNVLHHEIEPILRAHGTPIIGVFSRQSISDPNRLRSPTFH